MGFISSIIFGQTLGRETESDGPQMKKPEPKIPLHNKRIALAVRDAARYASIRDRVLEEYVGQRPDIRAEMERLNSQGLDPTAWLNVISVPWLFRIDERSSSGKLLAKVFNACELDPGKPRHWRILLEVDTNREDWSFGNGEMQYGPK